ncbi:MAG TPA: 4-carboxy-4-hydroxy-2-oxoadipate aldolase/oxaloacetate decarboxylase [Ruminiclostridium sp.]
MYDIVRNFKRPDDSLINNYNLMTSATLHEVLQRRGALSSYIKPIWPGMKLCGSALTVQCEPGDNLMIHKALAIAKPGDVLVVSVGGYVEAGFWGEVMTIAAISRGIKGLLTDGSVRDTMAIKEHGFPIFSKGICIKGTTKLTPGKINHQLILGGICINPGDIILGDNDGVVVVPLEEAEKALSGAIAREEKEKILMQKLESGQLTMDLLNLNDPFNELGLKEEMV